MKAVSFSALQEAVPTLEWTGTKFEGDCPSCHSYGLSVKIYGPDEYEPTCANRCTREMILDAARERLGVNKKKPAVLVREEEPPPREERTGRNGHEPEEKEPRLLKKFLTFSQLLTQPPPVWMLESIFFEQSLLEIYGASNAGKTFIAADMALCIRRGGKWCGLEIHKPGAVVYVNADGGLGFADRARAWQQLHEHDEESIHEFYTFPEPISLHRPQEMHEFLAAMAWLPEKPVFVVFDTYSQCIPGMNENLQEQASLVVQVLNKIRSQFGATPTLLHHTNAAGDRERGSNVIIGACDTQILIQKPEEGRLRMSCTKQRDAAYFASMHFDLVRVPGTNFVWPQINAERGDSPQEIKEGSLARMEAVLAEYPGATAKFLMRETGLAQSTLYDHIKELKMALPSRIFTGPPVNYGDEDWTTRKPVGYYNVPAGHEGFSE